MPNEIIIIGISGASASGKTVLANSILQNLGACEVEIIPEDSYYKDLGDMPMEERVKINYDHPSAFDHDLLVSHLLDLRAGKNIEVPCYDFSKHARTKEIRQVADKRIIILEGILLFSEPALRDLLDIRIFMDTPLDICLVRRLKRDIVERERSLDSVLNQYLNTVRPMYWQFIEPCKRYADVIVPKGGENRIALDMILAKMRELLSA